MAPDRETVLKGIECCLSSKIGDCGNCPYFRNDDYTDTWSCRLAIMRDALELLKEQDTILQKMWNALYAEENKLENKYVMTDEHDKWFLVYRPWLLLGFGIAINVISKQEERRDDNA